MLVPFREQLLGLREAALADPEQRERRHRRQRHRRVATPVRVERILERRLGLAPAAARDQDVGVDGAADSEHHRDPALFREVIDERAPLARPLPVARRRAGDDQVAVRLAERVHVADPPRGRRGHRLVEACEHSRPAGRC
jgi:hypothetical protein